ncbi:MAG: rRNA maturation RNase YbeY [Candidatus Acidiferrales bacterium]
MTAAPRRSNLQAMVLNRQKRVRVRLRSLDGFLHRAGALLGLADGAATICLVTDAQIAKWNRSYRGKNRPTDVLSFPVSVRAQNGNGRTSRQPKTLGAAESAYLGDVAIAPAVARRNARTGGRSFDQEVQILTLHGLLHLMGYDHEADDGAMERLEMRLRRKLGIA